MLIQFILALNFVFPTWFSINFYIERLVNNSERYLSILFSLLYFLCNNFPVFEILFWKYCCDDKITLAKYVEINRSALAIKPSTFKLFMSVFI